MKRQLVAAGRPEDEAEAQAQLVAEHYNARSERFGGQRGTAEEMYNRDMADVRAGRGTVRPREFAQEAHDSEIRANLSAATPDIPGINRLAEQANAGDQGAHHLLNTMAHDNLQRLLSSVPSAHVDYEYGGGLYHGSLEPSLGVNIKFNAEDRPTVLASLAKFADNFKQQEIHVREETEDTEPKAYPDGSHSTPVYTIDLKKPLTRTEVQSLIDKTGLDGLTYTDGKLEAYYAGHPEDTAALDKFEQSARRLIDETKGNAQSASATFDRLWRYGKGEGTIPFDQIEGNIRPQGEGITSIPRRIAERLLGGKEVEPAEQAKEITPEQRILQQKIAHDFERLPDNDLSNPIVKKAYEHLAAEIKKQFEALPIKVDAWKGEGEPYKNSAEMRKDIIDNNHLSFLPTKEGTFGPEGEDFSGHPLLEPTGIETDNGHPMLANDMLRVVHDYYAHLISSSEFGPKGEEAAWKNHMASIEDPWARWALTSETRGQNSWVNFGEHVNEETPLRDRPFARQKAALLPIDDAFTGNHSVDKPMADLKAELKPNERDGSVPNAGRTLYQQEAAPTFYSQLQRSVESLPQAKASPEQWENTINNLKGVKKEEIEWSGIKDWLKWQKGPLTKEQVQDYLNANNLEVDERVLDENAQLEDDGRVPFLDVNMPDNSDFDKEEVDESSDHFENEVEEQINMFKEGATPERFYEHNESTDRPMRAQRFVDVEEDEEGNKTYSWNEDAIREDATDSARESLNSIADYTSSVEVGDARFHIRINPELGEWEVHNDAGRRINSGTGTNFSRMVERARDALWDHLFENDYIRPDDEEPPEGATKFSQYVLAGGKNYKELLMTLPDNKEDFHGGHFDEDNVVAHIRFDDRTDAAGKKTLFVQEIQSDWHQKGREGGYRVKGTPEEIKAAEDRLNAIKQEREDYVQKLIDSNPSFDSDSRLLSNHLDQDEAYKEILERLSKADREDDRVAGRIGVPNAPFKTSWAELAMKRAVRWAAENGYDQVAWTTGEQQVDRYASALKKRVDKIEWEKTPEGIHIKALKDDDIKVDTKFGENQLSDAIGKAMGKQIIDDNNQKGVIQGNDLTISDTGMAGFYDKILPNIASKLGKKFGAEVGETSVAADGKQETVHSMPITDQMRKSVVQEGQPLFQGGARGKIRLASDQAKATITLMKNANASTFLHETGHHWLDELMKDADHAKAPDDLKQDADTVRKWLGNEGEELTVRQHEKFARGFERYLMEGAAPSKELAGVFAKFRQWLLQIYQSAQRLRSPINDDIRDVFDRLLAKNPEKQPIIAPEAEPGKAMADIHEADARTTPPEQAGKAADAVRSEVKATAQQHDEDIHNAITSAEKTGGSAGDTEETTGTSGGPGQSGPAEAATPPQPQPVGGGGNVAAAEGADLRAAAGEPSGSAAGKPQLVANPDQPLPRPKSDLIDKAGNIRLENLTNNEDVREVMRQVARENHDYMTARGGVVTDQMVSDLADAMGVEERELNIKKLQQISLEDGIPLAVRIKVGRQMLVQSANSARDAMIKAAASGSEQDLMNMADARRRHLMIAETVSSITAEWGRAGRAFRDISGEEAGKAKDITELFQRMTGKTPAQMLDMAKKGGALDTGAQVSKFIQDSKKPSFGDMILEYWINGLISGPATHVTYSIGNTLLTLWKSVPETAVASLLNKLHGGIPETAVDAAMDKIETVLRDREAQPDEKFKSIEASLDHPAIDDALKSKVVDAAKDYLDIPKSDVPAALKKIEQAFGKTTSGVQLGEIVARPKAAVKALPTAISAAGKALKTGVTTLLPGEGEASTPFQFGRMGVEPGRISNTDVTWKELGSDAFGSMKGMRDAFIGIGNLIKNGGVAGEPAFAVKPSLLGDIPNVAVKGIEIPVGDVARTPGRVIAALHSFFRTMNYSMEKAANAYRTATDEGLQGDDFTKRVADGVINPTPREMREATGAATEATLMGEGGKFTQQISRLTNTAVKLPGLGETKILKFIDPFVKISSNIIEQSILQRTPLGILSPEIRADLMGVNGPTARDFAQARMLVGTALGITIGGLAAEGLASGSGPSDPNEAAMWRLAGNQEHSIRIGDMWYDVHRLGPLGMIVSTSADMYGIAKQATQEDLGKVASTIVHAVTQNILDESFMRGPSDLIKAVTDSDRYGPAYVRNMIASFVPFSVLSSQIAHSVDPYSRQARSVMDAIRAKIPYESEDLLPKRDIWGEPLPNKSVLGVPGFSSIYETAVSNDPVNQAMVKLGISPAAPTRKIRNVELTDEQYDKYCQVAGQTAKMRLDAIVGQSGFSDLPPEAQVEIIHKTIEKSREMARNVVMMSAAGTDNDIIKKATDAKLKKYQTQAAQ